MSKASINQGELTGRLALVTGAGRGIGRAVSLELARRGAQLILLGRQLERLEACRAAVAELGGAPEALAVDITEREWFKVLAPFEDKIDILVHNAAGFARYAWIECVPEEEIEAAFDTILLAGTQLTAHLLPAMKERGFGRIVHIGSMAGSRGAIGQMAYAAAKAGLAGLVRSTALEGGPHGVTANLLELGLVDTERVRELVARDVQDEIVRHTPVGRIGRPEEIAKAVAFLVSPRAAFITGAVLPVNGGLGLGLYPEQLG